MASEHEIRSGIRHLQQEGSNYVLLHCNSTYPTPFKDVNLRYLERLRQLADAPVGYSGHERGIEVPIAAVALVPQLSKSTSPWIEAWRVMTTR